MMTRFIQLSTPTGELVFINPDQVTHLKDKDEVTHVHFAADGSGPGFAAVHLPIHEVAKLLTGE